MEHSNENKNPIIAIIENAMEENHCNYNDEELKLLSEYFIACIYLRFIRPGFFKPNEFDDAVSKFTGKIKSISYGGDFKTDEKPYYIKDEELTLSFDLYDSDEDLFKINFFKAVTEVIFGCVETDNGFSNGICNLVAEHIFNVITTKRRRISIKRQSEKIGDVTLDTHIGGHQLNIIMTLVKQMCLSQNFDELLIISEMFVEGYDRVLEDLNKKGCVPILIKMINKIFELQVERYKTGRASSEELECIEIYQAFVNYLFWKLGISYCDFLLLVTSASLREKLVNEKVKHSFN